MQILLAFGWLGWGVISVQLIFHFIGFSEKAKQFIPGEEPDGWFIGKRLVQISK
jgi:hypothetical protein